MFQETPHEQAQRMTVQRFYESNQSDFERIAKHLKIAIFLTIGEKGAVAITHTDLHKMWEGIRTTRLHRT